MTKPNDPHLLNLTWLKPQGMAPIGERPFTNVAENPTEAECAATIAELVAKARLMRRLLTGKN